MSTEDDNLLESLKQIKNDTQSIVNDIGKIKEEDDGKLLPDLEKIERSGYNVIFEIDEIIKQKKRALTETIERNSILARMPKPEHKPQKIGNVRV